MLTQVSRGIDSRREVPPPIRQSMIESERMPPAKAPGSLEPFGRWSSPSTSTVSVPVIMFDPELSWRLADAGIEPLWIEAETRNRTSDSTSQKTQMPMTQRRIRNGVQRLCHQWTLPGSAPSSRDDSSPPRPPPRPPPPDGRSITAGPPSPRNRSINPRGAERYKV